MKTAISLPDDLFEAMDAHARANGLTRSGLVQRAVRAWLDQHEGSGLTAKVNAALAALTDEEIAADTAVARAASARLGRLIEW